MTNIKYNVKVHCDFCGKVKDTLLILLTLRAENES